MTDPSASRVVLAVVVIALASSSVVGSVAGPATAPGSDLGSDLEAPRTQFAVQDGSDTDDNATRRHRDPREYDEDGNLEELEGQLTARMVEALDEGAIRLRDGEYDRAGRSVDDAYYEYLDQYAEISAETSGDDYDELFELAGENQRQTIETVRRYYERKDEYERARAAGDDGRARELARELETLARSANESSHRLRENYDDLEGAADANLSSSDEAIEEVAAEIRDEQEGVRDAEFEPTVLTVDAEREEISFREPLTAVGRLRTTDGRPIGNERIRLDVGNGSVRTETDADGSFAFEYRPTDEPLSTDRIDIEYVPDNRSVYLGSETSVDVSINQVEPTVSNLETTGELAYGETATVRGDLHVDGEPVDDVPLSVTLGDERIGTAETTNGSFETTAAVPASVADGQRELGVQLDYEDRALAATAATNDVTVRETESGLSLSASRPTDGERTIAVDGALETSDGSAVAGQTVRIDASGTSLETVTTDADGSFTATVEVPEETAAGDVRIVATFDGSATNLESATAASTVSFSTAEQSMRGLPAWAWLGLGVGLSSALVAVAVGLWSRTRADRTRDRPQATSSVAETGEDAGPTPDRSKTETARSLLAQGRDSLARGRPDRAVELGYAALRHAQSDRVATDGGTGALTHWEFYRRWADRAAAGDGGGSDDDHETSVALLRAVTEHYERATFGVTEVSSAEAEYVLEAVGRLCELDSEDTGDERDRTGDR